MKKLLTLLVLFPSCSCVTDILVPVADAGVLPTCFATSPPDEVCDGIDNDCNGLIDDKIVISCSNECEGGLSWCENGKMSQCSSRQPKPEECDGFDNDCDGAIDEDLGIRPCYPRNPDELQYGECRFGIDRCIAGNWVCSNYVGPETEVCDGRDNDCDGLIDENKTGPVDVILVVDYSGSMYQIIRSLRLILAQWIMSYSNRTDVRMALIGVPSPDLNLDSRVMVLRNFSPFNQLIQDINTYDATGGGSEATIDAVKWVCDPLNPLNLDFAPGAGRAMFVFTDEEPQSYVDPPNLELEALAFTRLYSVHTVIFTSNYSWTLAAPGWTISPMFPESRVIAAMDNAVSMAGCR